MNRKHLQMMVDFLERLDFSTSKLDLSEWWEDNDCGTKGCAVGWAASDQQFKALGLHLVKTRYNGYPIYLDPTLGTDAEDIDELTDCIGFDAVEAFFGIDLDTATWIFSPTVYGHQNEGAIARSQVIDRIKELLNAKT